MVQISLVACTCSREAILALVPPVDVRATVGIYYSGDARTKSFVTNQHLLLYKISAFCSAPISYASVMQHHHEVYL